MFRLKIATPEKLIYEGKASSLRVPTDQGEQEVLPGHEPYMAQISSGEMGYTDENGKVIYPFIVSAGFLKVEADVVEVILETALHSSQIDVQKAEEAKMRAQKLLSERPAGVKVDELKAQIRLANLHISAGRKHRSASAPDHELPE